MAGLTLTVVTPEREVLRAEDVEIVLAPGVDGQLGILPRHAPLVSELEPGTLCLRQGGVETCLSITGGFLEVMNDRASVLADASELADEIDLEEAEQSLEAARRDLEAACHSRDEAQIAQARLPVGCALARVKTVERASRR